MTDLESKAKEKFYESVVRELEQEERREGIHVSSLVYSCLRRAYYSETTDSRYEMEGALRMVYGRKIHELGFEDSEHEIELEYNGIVGRADEYFDGIVVDKKTTRNIPRGSARDHHARQIKYYGAMLDAQDYPVVGGVVLYIDLGDLKVEPKSVDFPDDWKDVREEMEKKKNKLQMALEARTPPERNIGWICKYCDYPRICFGGDLVEGTD